MDIEEISRVYKEKLEEVYNEGPCYIGVAVHIAAKRAAEALGITVDEVNKNKAVHSDWTAENMGQNLGQNQSK